MRLSGTTLRFFQLEKADVGIHGNDSRVRPHRLTCETALVTGREKRRSATFRLQMHLDRVREPAASSLGRAGWIRIELVPHVAKRHITLGDLKRKKVGRRKGPSLTAAEPRWCRAESGLEIHTFQRIAPTVKARLQRLPFRRDHEPLRLACAHLAPESSGRPNLRPAFASPLAADSSLRGREQRVNFGVPGFCLRRFLLRRMILHLV